jgi:preprotein translocase subunit SecA
VGEDLRQRIEIMISNVVQRLSRVYVNDAPGFTEWALRFFGVELDAAAVEAAVRPDKPSVEAILERLRARYTERTADWGPELTARVQNYLVLTAIDQKWKDHLHAMDALKAGIGLRGYGQQDPKIAYKKEASEMFAEQLLPAIEADVASKVLRIEVSRPAPPVPVEAASGGNAPAQAQQADALTPRGMVRAGAPQHGGRPGQATATRQIDPSQLNPQQLEQLKKAMAAARARQAMQQGTSATNAFDVMRRRKALEEAQARANAEEEARRAAAAEAAGAAASGGATPPSGTTPADSTRADSGTNSGAGDGAPQPLAPPQPLASSTPQRSAPPAGRPGADPRRPGPPPAPAVKFEGVGRNDACPCGSGKKYKKCHGQA